jgi:hypothetical protein
VYRAPDYLAGFVQAPSYSAGVGAFSPMNYKPATVSSSAYKTVNPKEPSPGAADPPPAVSSHDNVGGIVPGVVLYPTLKNPFVVPRP